MPKKTKTKSKSMFFIIDSAGHSRRFDHPRHKVGSAKEFASQETALTVAKANLGKGNDADMLYIVKATHKITPTKQPVMTNL